MDKRVKQIDQYLNTVPRGACDTREVGPFTLFFRRTSDMPFLSYARPTRPLSGDLGRPIEEVREAFHAKNRVPRWEWIAELAPGLAEPLVAAGLPKPELRPLMVGTPASY